MPKKSGSVTSSGAALVSVNLQRFVVITAAAAQFVSLLMLIPYYASNTAGFRLDYAMSVIVMTFFPLVIFSVAALFGPRTGTLLQRIFIAVVKTLAVQALIGLVTMAKNYLPTLFLNPTSPLLMNRSLLSSLTIDYVVMAIAVVAVIVYSLIHYNRK